MEAGDTNSRRIHYLVDCLRMRRMRARPGQTALHVIPWTLVVSQEQVCLPGLCSRCLRYCGACFQDDQAAACHFAFLDVVEAFVLMRAWLLDRSSDLE